MSLYNMMLTSVSGMNAQSARLSAVADNIANASTTGYKQTTTEFSSMFVEPDVANYVPGAVAPVLRRSVGLQGNIDFTTSVTDLAISGRGFFVVAGNEGQPMLTRAGAFVQNSEGTLVNSAGFKLLAYPAGAEAAAGVANGFNGLVPVNIRQLALTASASTAGTLSLNLPSEAAVAAGSPPSSNAAGATSTARSSLVTYNSLGAEVTLDVYSTKTAGGTWEMAVFDRAGASASGGFPYAAGPLATATLTFDSATGKLSASSAQALSVPIPGGDTLTLDVSASSQVAADYSVLDAHVNGNAPSEVDRIEITGEGELVSIYKTGARVPAYHIPLADVTSPDNLISVSGNAYVVGNQSGQIEIGVAKSGGLGSMVSSAIEKSNVDLAAELTKMIESQRSYTANSRVYQTGADLMDVLVHLGR